MSVRIFPRFSSPPRVNAWTYRSAFISSAIVMAALYGCSSPGSSFGTGGTGTPMSASGGNGTSTGGAPTPAGSGGSDSSSTGGTTAIGTGGNVGTSTGGDTGGPGSGGASASGGSVGTGGGGTATGGRGGAVSTGGSSVGTGGSATATGGAPGTGGTTAGPACPKPAGQICHEFLANDNSRNQINYVNEFDPTKNWVAPVGDTGVNSPRTIEIVNNAMATNGKAVLVNTNRGFGEYDLVTGRNLARVQTITGGGVTGAARLPDGNTALGTLPQIITVSPTGARVSAFALPNPTEDLRAINRNPANGNFWFSKLDDVFEVTSTGAQVWNANLGPNTKGYAVWWREGGGAYATTGDPSTVVEINAAKARVSSVGGKTMFPELDFFSGFVRLPNGNFVVANWLGHLSGAGNLMRPHVVEFTPQNQIVWRWGNQTQARQITNVYVLR